MSGLVGLSSSEHLIIENTSIHYDWEKIQGLLSEDGYVNCLLFFFFFNYYISLFCLYFAAFKYISLSHFSLIMKVLMIEPTKYK